MDNAAKMLEQLRTALINLQVRYRQANLTERVRLQPELETLLRKYDDYQSRLIEKSVTTTDDDLREMAALKTAIDGAAEKQQLAATIAKTIAFLATRLG